jgi:hypothetical protein
VIATDKIQYKVDNVNIEVVMARSHFRDRLWSPLVLCHHEKSFEKKSIRRIERWIPYTMTRTAIGMRHKYIPGIRGGSVINTDYVGEVAEMTDHRAILDILCL